MKQDVIDYVKGCADCQRMKVNNRPTKAPLQPIYPRPEAMPFETVTLDFIVKLPVSSGYDSILTITDHDCTKASVFIPCNEEITAEGTAALYLKHVFIHYGLPAKMISDRDPRFTSRFIREICRLTGIERNPSTAYHPRTDGQSERTNQWLETYLRFFTDHQQTNWAAYLPIAQFAHNNWPSDTTRKSPFFLLMGFNPRAEWTNGISPLPQVTLRLDQLKEARDSAQSLMIKAQKSWVKHRDTPKYKVGDQVWLEGKNLRINQPTHKLAPRRYGPFKVIQVMSPVNYRLELPTQWSIHPVFHTDLLTPYRETITHGANYQRPPPDLVDNEEEYEVEAILDSRKFGRGRRLQYLIKWKGYPDSDNQWVDKDDVSADDKVREFKASNPAKETHIRGAFDAHSSHPPHSHLFSFIDNHMSSSSSNDNNNDFAEVLEYANTVFAPQGDTPPATRHLRRLIDLADNAIADALEERLGRLSLDTPTQPTPQHAEEGVEIHRPEPPLGGDDNRNGMEDGTVAEGEEAVGSAQRTAHQGRSPSNDRSLTRAQGLCGQCHGPLEYCHGHTSPEPLPVRPRTTIRTATPTTPSPRRVVSPEDRGSQSESLARNLINAILQHHVEVEDDAPVVREDNEDPATLPPPYFAEGMGVRGGRRGRRGRGNQGRRTGPVPIEVVDVETLQPPPFNVGRRPQFQVPPIQPQDRSQPPVGFEHNRGTAYVPFNVIDRQGREVPARYIQVHMNDDNPYVVGRMFAGGNDIYRGEIHAAPVHDINHAPEPLTAPMLRMLGAHNPAAHHFIDAALERLHDRSLTGEVLRFRRFERRIDRQREGIRAAEERLENMLMDRNLCEYRLREAHAVRRLVGEMVNDQRTIRYVQGDPQARQEFLYRQQMDFDIERGRSP